MQSRYVSLLVIVLTGLVVVTDEGVAQIPRPETWVTNGRVSALVATPTTLYVGGYFDYVGPYTGCAAPVDSATGAARPFPKVDETVYACESDGSGGWYIGGNFRKVDDVARRNLAHILADGSVDPAFDPSPNTQVDALVLRGSTLYVGGQFATIDNMQWPYLVALDAATGHKSPAWISSTVEHDVAIMAVSGNRLFIGGAYIPGGIMAMDATSGGWILNWNGTTDGAVYATVVVGGTLYIGGDFSQVNSESRANLAALDLQTGNLLPWNPNVDLPVFALAASPSTLYAGGEFSQAGTQPRNRLAAFSLDTGALLDWQGEPSSNVTDLAVGGSNVYVGGEFLSISNEPRRYLAALDAATAEVTEWNPSAGYWPFTLKASEDAVMVGGAFHSVGGVTRNCLAALDQATGAATDWDPAIEGLRVVGLAASDTTLYIGGDFTSIGGQPRNRLASFDLASGDLTSWSPGANNTVWTLAVDDSTVYAGGWFTNLSGLSRSHIGSIEATTGAVTGWNPGASSRVVTLTVSGSTLYAGGEFTTLAGTSRRLIGSFDLTSGSLTAWNPTSAGGLDPVVNAIAVLGSTVYAGGEFTAMGGQPRNALAALSADTGLATAWAPTLHAPYNWNPQVLSLLVSEGLVYVGGGTFDSVNGAPRASTASINVVTGAVTSWNPGAQYVYSVLSTGSSIYLGGMLGSVGGEARTGLVEFRDGFVTEPADAMLYTGDLHMFQVDGNFGYGTPSFQWKWRNLEGTVVDSVTMASWGIFAVSPANAGEYWCEVSCGGDFYESAHATVQVKDHLEVSVEPSEIEANVAEPFELSAVTSGGYEPLTYRWLLDGVPIPDATESTCVVIPTDIGDAGIYTVEVADALTDVASASAEMVFADMPVSSPFAVVLLVAALVLASVVAGRIGVKRSS